VTWQEWKDRIGRKLHAIVDRALENSSVALYDQSLRDMEDYIVHVEEAAVGMKAAAEGNKRRLAQYQSEVDILDTRLNQLTAEDQAEQAQRVQQALNVKRQQIADTQAQIERQEEQHKALVHNWETLKERLRVLQGERGSVVALLTLARAERTIGNIEHTLGGLADLGTHSQIGAMAGHILQRLDEAEARLALVDVDAEVARAAAAIEEARVEEQLVERRRRLGMAIEEVKTSETPVAEEQPSVPETTAEEEEPPAEEPAALQPLEPAPEESPEATEEPPSPPEV
jgi:archaellum component FlaC